MDNRKGIRIKRVTYKKGRVRINMNGEGDDMIESVEPVKLNCMKSIRSIVQKAVQEQGLSERQIRKSLGMKRYEK